MKKLYDGPLTGSIIEQEAPTTNLVQAPDLVQLTALENGKTFEPRAVPRELTAEYPIVRWSAPHIDAA